MSDTKKLKVMSTAAQEALRKRLAEWRKVNGRTAPIERHNVYANSNKTGNDATLEQAQAAAQVCVLLISARKYKESKTDFQENYRSTPNSLYLA